MRYIEVHYSYSGDHNVNDKFVSGKKFARNEYQSKQLESKKQENKHSPNCFAIFLAY